MQLQFASCVWWQLISARLGDCYQCQLPYPWIALWAPETHHAMLRCQSLRRSRSGAVSRKSACDACMQYVNYYFLWRRTHVTHCWRKDQLSNQGWGMKEATVSPQSHKPSKELFAGRRVLLHKDNELWVGLLLLFSNSFPGRFVREINCCE